MSKTKYYPDVEANPSFPAIEERVLKFWQKKDVFAKSISGRNAKDAGGDNNEFVFYDGPPFANGLPHYGHLLTGFVKDAVARYQTMKGKKVERKFGWDCHGLPAEMASEKELGISGRHKIAEFGIGKFNDHCRQSVMKYADQWEKYVGRQARWVDFTGGYKTMDVNFMESVLWAFKQLYDKGLVYESMRVMPYSWACETPLSNFETRLDNSYREHKSKAVTVAFELKDRPEGAPEAGVYKMMAWTTTPWTLPSNLALAIGEGINYSCVVKDDVCYIIATSSLSAYKSELALEEGVEFCTLTGSELAGLSYKPLFDYFAGREDAFKVLLADFVQEGDGTGIVHIAPGFGEDDQMVCQQNGIELVCPVDNAGKFTSEVPDYEGMQVFEANDEIIKYLKGQGSWIKTDQYVHNYPHCWRTDTPLIYKAVPSWYVRVTDIKDRMVANNQKINWVPGHIKDGQFGKWLENARDWSISRNRFWGSPIPVWKSDNPQYPRIDVYGSIAELEEDFGVKIEDLHRPYIDELTRPNPDDPTGKSTMRRVEDVFDCWFESGSMPYAQVHYPFENKDWFENHFPADFIVEYVAQTRGWFYTLMILSTALFDRPPFLNVVSHGVVLDEKGQKLSKRLNNYADPIEIFDKFGADAMRWLMMSSPIMHGGELLIDKQGNMVRDAVRLVLKPVWNAYNFFVLYANADYLQADLLEDVSGLDNYMDRYILAKCKVAVRTIEAHLDAYDTPAACKVVESFFEVLNNWYIRRNKERFWKSSKDTDKQNAYDVLYSVLHIMVRAMCPLMPLLSEEVFLGLNGKAESVHLQDFPDIGFIEDCNELIEQMDRVRDVCNTALSIRNSNNIRVRQPLQKLSIIAEYADSLEAYSSLIQDEINVKEIILIKQVEQYADYKLKINFPVLGKRLPQKMKELIAKSKQGQWSILDNGLVEVAGEVLQEDECALQLTPKEAGAAEALSSNDALVMLDIILTQGLKVEGIARDLVRLVQQSRKDAGLDISDKISLYVGADNEDVKNAMGDFADYIAQQTLATDLCAEQSGDFEHKFEHKLEGANVTIGFGKVA